MSAITRQTINNPTAIDELAAQRAVFMLLEIAGKGVDVRNVVRDCVSAECSRDRIGRDTIESKLSALSDIGFDLNDQAWQLWSDYSDARMELEDNPDSLCPP